MKTITQEYKIDAPISKVWHALVDIEIIRLWGGDPLIMDDKVGTEFKLWGGSIYGTNTEVDKGKRLSQSWSDGELEEFTSVTFDLEDKGNQTIIHLTQSEVPDNRYDDLYSGWQKYYLGPLKELVETK